MYFLARGGKSPSRSSSSERPASSDPFVRVGSLKAWKEEQDRVKAEEEEKERAKADKRVKSAQKRVQAGAANGNLNEVIVVCNYCSNLTK